MRCMGRRQPQSLSAKRAVRLAAVGRKVFCITSWVSVVRADKLARPAGVAVLLLMSNTLRVRW